jgi:hypothetical protein
MRNFGKQLDILGILRYKLNVLSMIILSLKRQCKSKAVDHYKLIKYLGNVFIKLTSKFMGLLIALSLFPF